MILTRVMLLSIEVSAFNVGVGPAMQQSNTWTATPLQLQLPNAGMAGAGSMTSPLQPQFASQPSQQPAASPATPGTPGSASGVIASVVHEEIVIAHDALARSDAGADQFADS